MKPAFRVGPTVGSLSVSDRSKCYLVLLKMPRKLTLRSLQTCQGSGVGSIPIGRSILSTGSKIITPVLDWSVEDLVVQSDTRGFGVGGSFSQCAFALIVW